MAPIIQESSEELRTFPFYDLIVNRKPRSFNIISCFQFLFFPELNPMIFRHRALCAVIPPSIDIPADK